MTSRWRVLALLPLLAVAACGSGASADDDDALAAGGPPDGLVLQVVRTGGFLPVGAAFRSVPVVSVYGDGRVVSQGPQIEVWPPPALPSLQVGRLDATDVRRLVDAGRQVVDADDDYGQPPVADAPTTAVVVQDGDQRSVAAAVALDELPADGAGLTAGQAAARDRLRTLVREVQDAAAAVSTSRYEPTAVAVLAEEPGGTGPVDEPVDGPVDGPASEELAWPGPALAAGTCVVVTGAEADEVLEVAAGASTETRWTVGGQVLRLALRPLLPHEQTCEDATEQVVPPSP